MANSSTGSSSTSSHDLVVVEHETTEAYIYRIIVPSTRIQVIKKHKVKVSKDRLRVIFDSKMVRTDVMRPLKARYNSEMTFKFTKGMIKVIFDKPKENQFVSIRDLNLETMANSSTSGHDPVVVEHETTEAYMYTIIIPSTRIQVIKKHKVKLSKDKLHVIFDSKKVRTDIMHPLKARYNNEMTVKFTKGMIKVIVDKPKENQFISLNDLDLESSSNYYISIAQNNQYLLQG